jgi:hypothetical protein
MALSGFINRRNNLFFTFLITLVLMFFSSAMYCQSPVNFSGVWIQDNVKSDDFYKSFDVKCTITQTSQSITIKQTFFDKSGNEVTSHDNSFTLDGKEISKEEEGGVNKTSAIWSSDKKTLTTSSTRTVGTDVYGSIATYSLSDNGLVLTIQTKDINPSGLSVKQIFNKNQ